MGHAESENQEELLDLQQGDQADRMRWPGREHRTQGIWQDDASKHLLVKKTSIQK